MMVENAQVEIQGQNVLRDEMNSWFSQKICNEIQVRTKTWKDALCVMVFLDKVFFDSLGGVLPSPSEGSPRGTHFSVLLGKGIRKTGVSNLQLMG